MQSRKDSFISKSTCYITLYSILIVSYRLVTCARAAAYTKNNILSAFEATGIWPLNPCKVIMRQSRNITPFESPPATPTPLRSATPRQPRAVSQLSHSALHLVTHQSPSSLKLKALIAQLARSAQGVLRRGCYRYTYRIIQDHSIIQIWILNPTSRIITRIS